MNNTDSDNSFIAEALPAFMSEAHEHTAKLEQLLLQLESEPDNRELLDALFRSAHTIKGSAGIFGLDAIVEFTHHVETLLDQLRSSQKRFTPELSTLLLKCNDEIQALVCAAEVKHPATPAAAGYRESLVALLREAYAGNQDPGGTPAGNRIPQHAPYDCSEAAGDCWRVAVAFKVDTFRNGMDPLAILNYVRGLGAVTDMRCNAAAVPTLDSIDPEDCHLACDFRVSAEVSRERLYSAFSFVRDDCQLHMQAPAVSTAVEDLHSNDGDGLRVGEILLDSGAITASQLHEGLKIQSQIEAENQKMPLGEILVAQAELSQNALDLALRKQKKLRDDRASTTVADESRFIRVQADRLDHVINLLGELVIASAGASLLAQQSRQSLLIEANQQITSLVEEIRNGTLQLRMVPVGETFARFKRVVRDTAAELGKDIALDIVGGETELDKSVVERISDPLMHLVRNALDHGLEKPAVRVAAGKSPQGRLTLSACHESGSVLIRIIDDGAGIDLQKVLARARERGLVDTGTTPSDTEILNLIFEPGFSTAEKVTNLSGRGVGMDVVRRNIEALRGSITVSSTLGTGSCMEIRLPLTLAIIDGFLISVGTSKFIFPLDGVVEVVENQSTAIQTNAQGGWVIELRGQILPVISLRSLYLLDSPEPKRCSVVVIQAGTRRYGVLVDALCGQHQTVIKPLGRILRSLRGISGSSILGNGEVALIFDVHALCQLAEHPPTPPLSRSPSPITEVCNRT